MFVEELTKLGIEIWSAQEKEQLDLMNPEARLISFIKYWKAGSESSQTSMRVAEKHRQMTLEGLYRGGEPPYGYRLVDSGIVNKKGKLIKKLAINEKEVEVVKLIYDLALNYGMGGHRIAKYLNEHGIKPRKGDEWNSAVINYMLRNPIYKGHLTSGKTKRKGSKHRRVSPKEWVLSEKPLEELIIIPEDIWNQVQLVKFKDSRKYRLDNLVIANTLCKQEPIIVYRFIYCGAVAQLSTGMLSMNGPRRMERLIKNHGTFTNV